MHFRLLGLTAAAVGLAMTAAPAAAGAGAVIAMRPTGSTITASALAPHRVLFLDGESALVTRTGGRTALHELTSPRNGLASASTVLSVDGKTYDLPFAALPFLGRGLDPSLFDAAALAQRESGGRVPVQVRYRGAAVPHLPGITITASDTAGTTRTASGYLTAASARDFGAALARQYVADRAHASYGRDGIFAGGVSVSLAGAPATDQSVVPDQSAQPQFVMKTLTITGNNLSGRPDTGDVVLVFNVDNGNLNGVIGSTQVFYRGIAKCSVPVGHYFAIAGYLQLAHGNPLAITNAHIDVLPQFTVARNTTVRTSARAATSRVTMVTPRPAKAESSDFSVLRRSASGPPSETFVSALGASIWVSPTSRKPTTGELTSFAAQQLSSPAGPGTTYQYELSYIDSRGIIPKQTYRVRPASLAKVTDTFYEDVQSSGQWNMFGDAINPDGPPQAGYINPYPHPISLPGRQIRYIGGNAPGTAWGDYFRAKDAAGVIGNQYEQWHTVRPGEHLTDSWNQYPLHPGPNVNPDPRFAYALSLPSASRKGNMLTLSVTPFDDNQPGHDSPGFVGISGATTVGSYRIEQNGTQVAGGSVPVGPAGTGAFTTQAVLSPGPSTISFELNATQTGPSFPLSTGSKTAWTWRSSHESGGRLPQGWYCDDATLSSHCRAEPMMTLWYHVKGMALNGTTSAGQQVLDLTVGHIEPAAPIAITGATVQVSFDDGTTWRAAKVTSLGGGKYRVVYTAPAGVYVTMRTAATDAAGGRITETITRGYQIAP